MSDLHTLPIEQAVREAYERGQADLKDEMALIAETVDTEAAGRALASADVMAFAMLHQRLLKYAATEEVAEIKLTDLSEWMSGYDFKKEYLDDGVVRYSLKVVS